MNLAQVLEGKKVCVLMTCKREPYIGRVKEREYIYEMIQRNGFVFFYLYAYPDIEDSYNIEYIPENNRYILTVKTCDSWNALGLRMHLCYTFFNQYDIQGILKIDDDIHIDPEYENFIFNKKTFEYDYLGVVEKCIKSLKIKNENSESGFDVLLEIPRQNIVYYGGPFYWLSKTAIQKVVELNPVSIIEDANVGYCMTLWKECKRKNTNWSTSGILRWE
jgi:hypothetical protein